MDDRVSLSEIRDFIDERQESGPIVGGCRNQVSTVSTWLRNNGFSEDEFSVNQSYFDGEAGLAEHFYICVEVDGQNLILDPTVSQFAEENFYEGRANTYVPESEIPDVGVIDSGMEIYERYV